MAETTSVSPPTQTEVPNTISKVVFDIETDGLLDVVTRVHSLVIYREKHDTTFSVHGPDVATAIREQLMGLDEDEYIIGHNIVAFDLPVLRKLYPWFTYDINKVYDTFLLSSLIYPHLSVVDTTSKTVRALVANNGGRWPFLCGSHSLDAWGWRLGEHKGDYSKIMKERGLDPWAQWSQEMQDYCEQDVVVTRKLFGLLMDRGYAERATRMEHELADVIHDMEVTGYPFDEQRAATFYSDLCGIRAKLEQKLLTLFDPWYAQDGDVVEPKRTVHYKDPTRASRVEGAPFTPVKRIEFNPQSRAHITDRLMKCRGWKPKEFTDNGAPKLDEGVLKALPYPEAEALAQYMGVQKYIGMLAEGAKAHMRYVKADGCLHGRIKTAGAITRRATHSEPHVGQVPAVDHSDPLHIGARFRECYHSFPGQVQVGIDVSGLELRMLGHYMARYDGGAYAREVVEGDVHTLNQKAAGLPTRNLAKTFIYAFLYGAGDMKIATIAGLKNQRQGGALKREFLAKTPALKKLIDAVQSKAKDGFLVGLDGGIIRVRSQHAALNTLLQSAGSIVCKFWIVEFARRLKERGWYNTRVRLMAWVHDELQTSCDPEIAEEVGKLAVECIAHVGRELNVRVELTGEYKIGKNWKECH